MRIAHGTSAKGTTGAVRLAMGGTGIGPACLMAAGLTRIDPGVVA